MDRKKEALDYLRDAWIARLSETETEFAALMDKLDGSLPQNGLLRAEWLLLSVYLHFPQLDKMLPLARQAEALFEGTCSLVILPDAPWAFYEFDQLTAFHTETGDADREADMLEEFIAIYTRLTGGHGNGADALFRAELAFLRHDTTNAEILAHKAVFLAGIRRQKIIQLGAAKLLASIAMRKGDVSRWQDAINTIERVVDEATQNAPIYRTILDVIRGMLLADLDDHGPFAEKLTAGLTKREYEIALLATEGLRNSEIADKLFVSENTVRAHLRAIYQKLDIDRRAKLVKLLK